MVRHIGESRLDCFPVEGIHLAMLPPRNASWSLSEAFDEIFASAWPSTPVVVVHVGGRPDARFHWQETMVEVADQAQEC